MHLDYSIVYLLRIESTPSLWIFQLCILSFSLSLSLSVSYPCKELFSLDWFTPNKLDWILARFGEIDMMCIWSTNQVAYFKLLLFLYLPLIGSDMVKPVRESWACDSVNGWKWKGFLPNPKSIVYTCTGKMGTLDFNTSLDYVVYSLIAFDKRVTFWL